MNFMFEWQEQYCSCHENIKFISSSQRVIFFLLYKHTDDGVFDDLPKISEDFFFPKTRRTFPNIFREFTEISEDFRRLPSTFE